MDYDQILIILILIFALIFFLSGIFRYDVVASITLLLSVFFGLVPFKDTFTGFSHSAVITVAAVFVISRAVENTGILSEMSNYLRLRRKHIPKQNLIICSVVIVLSAFINNVAAVALMLPLTLQIARIKNIPRQALLMPLAFSSLMGGLITLIGTPPNIIISNFRKSNIGNSFYFFDFAPVGLGVSIVGIIFIAVVGWRLLPLAKGDGVKKISEKFTVELKVAWNSRLVHKKVSYIMKEFKGRFNLFAIVREGEVIQKNLRYYTVKANDIFIMETDKWTLGQLINEFRFTYLQAQAPESREYFLSEVTILPQSSLCNKSIKELNLLESYGIEIIAISRRNVNLTQPIKEIVLEPGDALLIKSSLEITQDKLDTLNCVIFEEKNIHPFSKRASIQVLTIFGIALVTVIFNLIPADVAFFASAVVLVMTRCISLKETYQSINLPIIVLIGTLIPVGAAMETTGVAKIIAQNLYYYGQVLPIGINLFFLIVVSMLFSNLINNAAIALIFSPIALQIASGWGASPDPFLMAVAVGASCTFLTPIGHQSNILVWGPGNYKFSDYWRMGLPLTILISIVATLLIMLFWPFY